MHIKRDDLSGVEVAQLLAEHLQDMHKHSPPQSVHALNLDHLRRSDITFWTVWINHELAGCGALKELNPQHGEIKSMRTARAYLRNGVARALLTHILGEANTRGYHRVSLETGSMQAFVPARTLYQEFGFQTCKPFAQYSEDPNSVFYTLALG